ERLQKLRRVHVVGIVAEARNRPRGMRRIGTALVPPAAQPWDPGVVNGARGQRCCQERALEMRPTARRWECTDIRDAADAMGVEERQEFIERSVRMANGIERKNQKIASETVTRNVRHPGGQSLKPSCHDRYLIRRLMEPPFRIIMYEMFAREI